MFGDKGEDWTPFRVNHKVVQTAAAPDPNAAVEVQPITASRRIAVIQPTTPESKEAEAPAETDPKVSASPAMSNASASGDDSLQNGNQGTPTPMTVMTTEALTVSTDQTMQTETPIHPSTLPPDVGSPVSAEREPSQTPEPSSSQLKLG